MKDQVGCLIEAGSRKRLAINLKEKFLKVSAENAVKIRFLILMISVGIGYLASSFFISVYEMSRQVFIGQF